MPSTPRISRRQATLVKAYAAANDLRLRTAQHHRKTEDPRWAAFVKAHGSGFHEGPAAARPLVLVAAVPLAESFLEEDFSGVPLPEEMERRHERLWRMSVDAAERCQRAGDWVGFIQHSRTATELRKAHQDAYAGRVRAEIEARELIPVGAFTEFAEVFHPLIMMVHNMPNEAAEKANPEHPEVALAALREWLGERWNPAAGEFHAAVTKMGGAQ